MLWEFNGTVVAFLLDQVKGLGELSGRILSGTVWQRIQYPLELCCQKKLSTFGLWKITTITHIGTAYLEKQDRECALDKYAQTSIILPGDPNVIAKILIHILQDTGLKKLFYIDFLVSIFWLSLFRDGLKT